jgi:hypothetical protein
MGSDFDIDKLYVYSYAHELGDDGKITIPRGSDEDPYKWTTEEIINEIIFMHHEVLGNPDEKIQKSVHTPISFGKLKDGGTVAKDIGTAKRRRGVPGDATIDTAPEAQVRGGESRQAVGRRLLLQCAGLRLHHPGA